MFFFFNIQGADIIGINCHFDPTTTLKGIKVMKDACAAEGLHPHLMAQPLAYHTPDCNKQGFIDLPEFPFGKNLIVNVHFCFYIVSSYVHFIWKKARATALILSEPVTSPSTLIPGLETRLLTRWEMHKYAREAYDLGVRYIGGCCGFEAYHVRAVCEELAKERGCLPDSSEKHDPWGAGLKMHTKPWVRAR